LRIPRRKGTCIKDGEAAATCCLCAQEIYRGERAWYCRGLTVCEDCFPRFARQELYPYEITMGGNDDNDLI